MRTLALLFRSFTSLLVVGAVSLMAFTAVRFFMGGFWLLGGAALLLGTAIAIWFARSTNRALADEALRASEDHDAAERDV